MTIKFSKRRNKICQSGKLGCPVFQTRLSGFDRTKTSLSKEDDCSMSSSDDDDNTDNEYDEQELLVEFKKLISKHMKL
jgi:hypothetical protein